MLIEERLSQIVALIEEKRSVTIQELMQLFQASESTIRRDLNLLDTNGQITKVHGGAIAIGSLYHTHDDDMDTRHDLNHEAKVKIAKFAASLIKPNDFIYLDAGTTTELMIDYIDVKDVVFVTNALSHAKKLAKAGCTVYVLGGEFKVSTEAVVGDEAINSLEKYNFTKGFWGTNGVSITSGFSTPDVKEAMLKKKAMQRCKKCYVLCDDSKFSQISSVTFADLSSANIITNQITDDEFLNCSNITEVKEK
ncbi:transcriptional repressor of the fructose operon, DeoR family [Lachnospiraceae bacterium KM106-2]|nr:transcriptional repressor of the fructose operon, DeoR family [Lachnospiraceae bacterium KM106-2]